MKTAVTYCRWAESVDWLRASIAKAADPSKLSLIGFIGNSEGRLLRLRQFGLDPLSSACQPQIVVVCGTSMDAGINGGDSARAVLRNPSIETAVLEIGYEGILGSGLGYDRADVAVITQISERHSNLDGLDHVRVLVGLNAVVANSVNSEGSIVLNGDDERCVEIGTQVRERVVYFSMCAENPVVEKHVRAGGQAVVLKCGSGGDGLYLFDGRRAALMFNGDIPARFDERDRPRIANVLAAAAACAALDFDSTNIAVGLRTFGGH
jgi:cyanophycin synthetase